MAEIKTEQELLQQNNDTFRDEGTDAHILKGPVRAAETRELVGSIIKSVFTGISSYQPVPAGFKWVTKPTITLGVDGVTVNVSAGEALWDGVSVPYAARSFTGVVPQSPYQRVDTVFADKLGNYGYKEGREGMTGADPSIPDGTAPVGNTYWSSAGATTSDPNVDINVVQATGTSTTDVMSQDATTRELGKKVDAVAGKGLSDTNYTQAEKDKLAALDGPHFKGTYASLTALQTAHPTASAGDYAHVDAGVGADVQAYIWDVDDAKWVLQTGSSTAETAASIKTKYESNADTNAFTDAEKTKLGGLNITLKTSDGTVQTVDMSTRKAGYVLCAHETDLGLLVFRDPSTLGGDSVKNPTATNITSTSMDLNWTNP